MSWDITDGDGNIIASGGHGASGASTAYCAHHQHVIIHLICMIHMVMDGIVQL